MKPFVFLLFLSLAGTLQAKPPGGKTLAELVRERFEANPVSSSSEDTSPAPEPTNIVDPTTPSETPEPVATDEPEESEPEKANPPAPGSTVLAEPGSTVPAEPGSTVLAEPGSTVPAEPGSTVPAEPEPTTPTTSEPTPDPEPEPAPPQAEEKSEPLPDFGPETETYKIKSGDTLGRIARNLYRSSSYSSLLQYYNKVDPRRLRIGQDLKTPSFSELTSSLAPKLIEFYPTETRFLLELHQEYSELEDKLSSGPVTDERKMTIKAIQEKLTQIEEGMASAKNGATSTPRKSLAQLKSLQRTLTGIHDGDFTITSKKGAVGRTHLALSLTEAIKWAR